MNAEFRAELSPEAIHHLREEAASPVPTTPSLRPDASSVSSSSASMISALETPPRTVSEINDDMDVSQRQA